MNRDLNRLNTVDEKRATEPTAETRPSESVEWQDLSVKMDGSTDPVNKNSRVTDRIRAHAGEPLTIETGIVTATLIGVPKVRIDDLAYAHQRDRIDGPIRACALFDIKNTSSVPIHWTSRQTKFIGSDTYTYKQTHFSLDPSQLGAGCYPRQVEVEPGCRARVITPVEQLPPEVTVKKIIQTISPHGRPGSQRLTFSL